MATLTAGRDIVLVRHGETDWNREKRIQGSLGASINDAGKEQAKGLARLLWEVPLQAVYSSTLPRAIETASYVAGPHSLGVITDPRLNEIHHGEWEGIAETDLPDPELYRRWREDPSSYVLPGAEPLQVVHDRAVAAMKDIVGRHIEGEGLVAVVSHVSPTDYPRFLAASGPVMVLTLYLPSALLILRRPNEGSVPKWLERRIPFHWPTWLRGTAPSVQ